MTGHTPGPWTTFRRQEYDDDCWPNGKAVYAVRAPNATITIPSGSQADAQLIAASPDLFEALLEILEDPEAKILDSHREAGWAAIHKATRSQP